MTSTTIGDMGDLLGRLVDRSLVLATAGADGTTRYTLLETMRAYGQERLAERGSSSTPSARLHARCGVALVEQAAPHLLGPQSLRWADNDHRCPGRSALRPMPGPWSTTWNWPSAWSLRWPTTPSSA